jgi:hypothetical protein
MKQIFRKLMCGVTLLAMPVMAFASCVKDEKETKYNEALAKIESGDYKAAYDAFNALGDYKDTEKYLEKFRFFMASTKRIVGDKVKGINFTLGEDNLFKKAYTYRADGTYSEYEYFFDETATLTKHTVRNYDGKTYECLYTYTDFGQMDEVICSSPDATFPSYKYYYDEKQRPIKDEYMYGEVGTLTYERRFDEQGYRPGQGHRNPCKGHPPKPYRLERP